MDKIIGLFTIVVNISASILFGFIAYDYFVEKSIWCLFHLILCSLFFTFGMSDIK